MSSRLIALDLYLRLREKPRLARAGSVVAARARMERVTRLVPLPRGLAVAETTLAGRAAVRIAPPPGGGMLLWLHGGAYCLGSHRTHAPLVAALAARAGVGAALPRLPAGARARLSGGARRRPRRLGRARRRGLGARADRARRRQRRRRARLRAARRAARRGGGAGGARRLQPVDRPVAVGRQPPAARPARRAAAGGTAARGARPLPRRRRPRRPARLAAPRRLPRRAAGAGAGERGRDPRRRRADDRRGGCAPRARRSRSTSSPGCRTSGSSGTATCPRPTRRWTGRRRSSARALPRRGV